VSEIKIDSRSSMPESKAPGKPPVGSIDTEINLIVNTIVEKLSPERIVLFGSYAYGEPTQDSDLDILVIVQQHNQPRYKRAREIRKCLWGKVSVPKDILVYTVDEIREWENVKQAFITSILDRGKVLYEKKG
jgi:predicted nucleotidyltransferase